MKIRQKNHGHSGTKLYNSWRAMKQRCCDKSQYQRGYQDKGIKVCDEWMRFAPFMEWAINNGYKNGLTIDRIDSEKDYAPNNCQWVTRSENIRRRNLEYDYGKRKKAGRIIKTINGDFLTVKQYTEIKNISYNTFRSKLVHLPLVIEEKDLKKYV